ncbi:MAG: TonB-dependent receptor plug domain-containing protein, partial [Bacteroidota bacterium]|nr:TonB-dependent receptor plug domain-containing protein [Bacteroidota bacterium]
MACISLSLSAEDLVSPIDSTDISHGTSIAPVEMESVTILAPRKDIGQIAHLSGSEILLDNEDIKRFDQVDGNQILQALPGVYTQQEDGWGLRLNVGLRGTGVLRSSRVTLMEDGVLTAPAPYASPAAYYTPAMWKYQNIEILKGSSQLIAGPQTTGGAINMVTPVLDEKNDLSITSAFGNYGQIRNFIQGEWKIAKRTSMGIALNRSQANGFKQFKNEAIGGYALNDGYLKIGH